MLPSEFTDALVKAYQEARKPLRQHKKIQRGESRSVASEIEDLLAFYLADNLPNIQSIRINQPLLIMVKGERKTIKPDLVIIHDNEICALVDLKMDLGYKRNGIASTFTKANDHIKAIRGKQTTYWDGGSAVGSQLTVVVSNKAAYFFVVVSDQNISKKGYLEVEKKARLYKVSLHTLIRGIHPNGYSLSAGDIFKGCTKQMEEALPQFQLAIADALA